MIDFGTGDPQEPTDPRIIAALKEGVRERMGYPAAAGLPELRETIAAWVQRRFGVTLDPDTQIVPTLGSKEAIFTFAHVVLDVAARRDTVVVTGLVIPSPSEARALPARGCSSCRFEENGFLPALDGVDADDWDARRSCG